MGEALKRTILIVDDEPLIRHNLVDYFDEEGFTVFEAGDADEAIAVLASNPTIRIVLTDVHMPGSMDGVKLAHFIRDRYPPTLLVVVSGAAIPAATDLPSRTLFVAKPFDPQFVLDELDRLGLG